MKKFPLKNLSLPNSIQLGRGVAVTQHPGPNLAGFREYALVSLRPYRVVTDNTTEWWLEESRVLLLTEKSSFDNTKVFLTTMPIMAGGEHDARRKHPNGHR